MRLLIYDETAVGHHPFYMRHTVAAARGRRGAAEVLYCFPVDLGIEGVKHVPFTSSLLSRALRLCDRRLGTRLLVSHKWRRLDRLVREMRADRVLLMDADEFIRSGFVPNVDWDWIPLYIHPRGARRPKENLPVESLRSARCRFVYTLDAGVVSKLAAAIGKEVRHFPDLAEADRADDSPLVAAVRQRSRGNPVIAALGTVTYHKNIALLLEVARRRPDWFFVVAGTVHWNRLSRPESALLGEAASWKNVLIHPESISDGVLNSMTSQSDVLYGCYLDFPHSSNKLTKACLFRVPVVVAEGDYMEEVVREYGIGAACDPIDAQSLERAIAALLSEGPAEPRWQVYLERNSVESLGSSVVWLFE